MSTENPRMSFFENAYISVFDAFDANTVSPLPYSDTIRKVTYGAVYKESGELDIFLRGMDELVGIVFGLQTESIFGVRKFMMREFQVAPFFLGLFIITMGIL